MLISHRKKFIYLKTVKTAGTSVEVYFEPWALPEDQETDALTKTRQEFLKASVTPAGIIGRRGGKADIDEVWFNHKRGRHIKQLIGDEIWNSYFKFCVIRNPYDRAVSMFYYANAKKDLTTKSIAELQDLFTHFVATELKSDKKIWTIKDQPCYDKIIRYEHLLNDMEEICNILDIPWDPNRLGNFKGDIRPKNMYTQLYTAEAKSLVENIHEFEFKLFDFNYPG